MRVRAVGVMFTSLGLGQHSPKPYRLSLPFFRAAPWVSAWSPGERMGGGRPGGRWMVAGLVSMRTQPRHHPSPQLSSGMVGKMRSPNLPHFPPQIPPQSSVVRPLLPPLTPGTRGNGVRKGELTAALRCSPTLSPPPPPSCAGKHHRGSQAVTPV